MTVILDSLKKSLDDIALFIQLRIKVMLNLEIGFVRNTSNGFILGDEKVNLLVTVCFICKNFFALEFYAFDKSNSRLAVVNLPAGQYHIQKLHSLVDDNMNLGVFSAT